MARRARRTLVGRWSVRKRKVDAAQHSCRLVATVGRQRRGRRTGSDATRGNGARSLARSQRGLRTAAPASHQQSRCPRHLLLAQFLAGLPIDRGAAVNLLTALGVDGVASRTPDQLSHGQAQRVAVARAVINRPALVLADEPTAALDDANAQATIKLLGEQADAVGATLVVASHDARIRSAFERRYDLEVPT